MSKAAGWWKDSDGMLRLKTPEGDVISFYEHSVSRHTGIADGLLEELVSLDVSAYKKMLAALVSVLDPEDTEHYYVGE